MVDQDWDRDAKRAGEKSPPQVKGPLDAVAANVTQKGQGSIIELSGLSAFLLGLEKHHFPPEDRRVSDGRVLLRRLKETLLAEAGLLIGLSEGDKGSVILDDLAREAALGWDGGDSLVCAGGAGRGQLVKLR